MSTWATGQAAERLARGHLEQHGLDFCACNYRCRLGEIDLVMQQQQTLVFVEVRYRQHQQYGGAIQSITPTKQQHLIAAAHHYLQAHYVGNNWPACRFDLVAIGPRLTSLHLRWLQNILQP